jgi:hypothetical protein
MTNPQRMSQIPWANSFLRKGGWLAESLGRGEGDGFSDVDLLVPVEGKR